MTMNKEIQFIWGLFGIEEDEEVLDMFLKVAKDISLDNKTRSEGYWGAGEVVNCLSASLGKADMGYFYFKKALELDNDNLDARLEICSLLFHPEGQFIINEKEFIENVLYLLSIDCDKIFNKYNDLEIKIIKKELQKLIKLYFKKRLEKLSNN